MINKEQAPSTKRGGRFKPQAGLPGPVPTAQCASAPADTAEPARTPHQAVPAKPGLEPSFSPVSSTGILS